MQRYANRTSCRKSEHREILIKLYVPRRQKTLHTPAHIPASIFGPPCWQTFIQLFSLPTRFFVDYHPLRFYEFDKTIRLRPIRCDKMASIIKQRCSLQHFTTKVVITVWLNCDHFIDLEINFSSLFLSKLLKKMYEGWIELKFLLTKNSFVWNDMFKIAKRNQ